MSNSQTTPSAPPRLLRSSLIVSTMTMLSRVLGLARDVVFAWFIGAAGGADAFFVAFKVPNFLRRLFAEGAFAQAFVPVLSEYRETREHNDVRLFVDAIAGCLGSAVITVSVLAVVGAPFVTLIFAPGFYLHNPEKYALTVDLLRITFPYLALISLAGFAGAILNSYDRFAIPAVTPVILNLVLISSAVWGASWFDVPSKALAWGVLVAGICQLAFQIPFLVALQMAPRPKVMWHNPAVKRVLKLMVPAMFGVSVAQLNLLLDTVLASLISDGSVSWLYYSDRLIELPLGVFGIAIATVILPTLSRQFSQADGQFSHTLDWALRTVLLIALPATFALMVLARPIVETLFFHGDKFTTHDVTMSSLSLVAYAIGLTAFMLIKVLATGYFSRQDTRTPVVIGVKAMGSNMLLNIVFVVPLHLYGQIGHVGLALATSASACLNAYWLFSGLHKGGAFQADAGWGRYFFKLVVACSAMVCVLILLRWYLPSPGHIVWWQRILVTAAFCVGGFTVFGVVMTTLGWRPRELHCRSPGEQD